MAMQVTPELGAILGGALGLTAFAWYALFRKPEPDVPRNHGGVHGTATTAQTLDQLREAGLTDKQPGGFFISELKGGRRFRLQDDTGVLVFGGPGTKKGVGFVIPTLLDRTRTSGLESILCYDPAGQNLCVTGEYLRSIGYEVVYMTPGGVLDDELRDRFGEPVGINPLGHTNMASTLAQMEINNVAGVMVPTKPGDSHPFFVGMGQRLTGVTGMWAATTLGDQATWPHVAELLHQSNFALNKMYGEFRKNDIKTVRLLGDALELTLDKDGKLMTQTEGMRSVLDTMRRELGFLLIDGIEKMFTGNFRVATMKQKRTALFLVFPEAGDNDALQKCAYVVLSHLISELAKPGGLPVLVPIDELCASLPQAAAKLIFRQAALLRKFKIRIGGVAQSPAQFVDWCGGETAANALRGLMSAIYYGANDPISLAQIQREAGQYTIWNPTTDIEAELGIQGGVSPIGRPLFFPEQIRAMIRNNEQLVFLNGSERVVHLPRVSYRDIPELKARAGEDPYHR